VSITAQKDLAGVRFHMRQVEALKFMRKSGEETPILVKFSGRPAASTFNLLVESTKSILRDIR